MAECIINLYPQNFQPMTSKGIHAERILILDFGSQYTQLIARRVRELGVYCEIHPHDFDGLEDFAPRGIILSGGPESATGGDLIPLSPEVFEAEVPVLGICYGMQVMARHLGGKVKAASGHEFGYARLMTTRGRLLSGLHDEKPGSPPGLDVWMSHGDEVTKPPPGFAVTAESGKGALAAMEHSERNLYGLQFHPEVSHTHKGREILHRFLRDICGCQGLWTTGNIIEDIVESVRTQVGDGHVILGLSGGVDSSVVAALLHLALGDRLTCIFVDNGLLRKNEADQVMHLFSKAAEDNGLRLNIRLIDASDTFLKKLKGIEQPEEKRRIIGQTFIEVFEEAAAGVKGAGFLAQGTIYPDVIESAGKKNAAHVIKSHHNVGGLPDQMNLELVEPLRELFKDEVRRLGTRLGLSDEVIGRHPFPGPGLATRILGEVRAEYAEILRQADEIFIEELRAADLYDSVSQAFAVFLPIKSVGVVGDARRYAWVIALRAVETVDFMTARWAHLPYDLLELVSRRIMNEIPEVSRVTYDVSSKPPATIEWE